MAKSGIFSTSINSGKYRLKGEWSATQNIELNQSTVTVDLYLEGDYALSVSQRTNTTITIDGTTTTITSPAISSGSSFRIKIGTASKTVTHNGDGQLSISMSAYYNINATISGTKYTSMTASSGTVALDTIPRASGIATFPSFTIGSGSAIVLDRKVSTFTHTLVLKYGTTTIATRTGVGASHTLTLDGTESNLLYGLLPTSTSATVTLYCTTYSGATQIGSTVSKTAIASISSSISPSMSSITASETVSAIATNIGLYVQNLSRIKFTINGATAGAGSSIKSYNINFDGVNYASSTWTSGAINKSGNITATATVTDNRGRVSSPKTVTVNLLPYTTPSVTSFTTVRCDSAGNTDPMGTYVKVTRKGGIQSLKSGSTEKNYMTFNVYYKIRGTTNWLTSSISYGGTATIIDSSSVHSGFPITLSYDFKIEVSDRFNTSSALSTISTGETVMSLGKNGIGVGKIYEQGALDIAGEVYVNGVRFINKDGNIAVNDTRTVVPPTDIGERGVMFDFKTNTIDGLNDGGTYHSVMTVQNWHDSSGGNVHQIGFTQNGNLYYRTATIGGTWGAWRRLYHDGNFNPSSYLPTTGGSLSGSLSFTGGTATNVAGLSDGSLRVSSANGYIDIAPKNTTTCHIYTDRPSFYTNKPIYVSGSEVWHSGNLTPSNYMATSQVRTGTCALTSSAWRSVSFGMTFSSVPRVVLTSISDVSSVNNGKIRNITTTGFEAIIGGTGVDATHNYIAISGRG